MTRRHSRAWHQMHDELLAERAMMTRTAPLPEPVGIMVTNPGRDAQPLCGTIQPAGLELDLWGGVGAESPATPEPVDRHTSRAERRAHYLQTGEND